MFQRSHDSNGAKGEPERVDCESTSQLSKFTFQFTFPRTVENVFDIVKQHSLKFKNFNTHQNLHLRKFQYWLSLNPSYPNRAYLRLPIYKDLCLPPVFGELTKFMFLKQTRIRLTFNQ